MEAALRAAEQLDKTDPFAVMDGLLALREVTEEMLAAVLEETPEESEYIEELKNSLKKYVGWIKTIQDIIVKD